MDHINVWTNKKEGRFTYTRASQSCISLSAGHVKALAHASTPAFLCHLGPAHTNTYPTLVSNVGNLLSEALEGNAASTYLVCSWRRHSQ